MAPEGFELVGVVEYWGLTPPAAPPEGEEEPENFIDALNPHSLEILTDAKVEPSLHLTAAGAHYQFLRVGYFVVDPDTTPDHIVFNRIVGLKDSWSKVK